jgi:UPF0755 protein
METDSRGRFGAEVVGNMPDGNDMPDLPEQTLREEIRQGGRFGGRRVMPRSPKEALQPDAAPPPPVPPSRWRPRLSAFSGFLSFLLLIAIGSMAGLVWGEHRMRAPGPLAANKVIYIAPGTEVPEIIAELDHEGVIDNPFLLNIALLAEGNRSKVKAGEYLFKQNISLQEVIDTLVSGKQVLHAVTIPEGLTSEQIVERLRESEILVGDITDVPKEGSLLPETYKVTRGAVRVDVIKKMQDNQKRVVDQIWTHRASGLPLRSPYELVTLASIVEKETGKADERPRVASVFLNRLKKGMRLQSDPTIVYGLTQGKGPLGRGITRAELEKLTPYNTYLIDGLPPGPIANPGRAALEAVANPSRTQDLYFVADGTGGHVFSETLDQHSRNVQRWRQIEKDAKDKQEQAAPEAPKAAPQTGPASTPAAVQPGLDRKSENARPTSVYGALPASLDAPQGARLPPILSYAPAAAAIAGATPATASGPNARAHKADTGISAYTLGRGLDELGISVGGVRSHAPVLDGPVGEEDAGDGSDESSAPQPQDGRPEHARVFDVSEGTPHDPLRNRTYDLNYAKTVPVSQ